MRRLAAAKPQRLELVTCVAEGHTVCNDDVSMSIRWPGWTIVLNRAGSMRRCGEDVRLTVRFSSKSPAISAPA